MKYLIMFMLFLKISSLYAFNWDECYERNRGAGHWLWGLFTSTYGTSEFSTSTGRCAMIGQVDYDKKVFFAQNFENLRLDTAQGGGEYLSAYAQLSQCDDHRQVMIGKTLQNHFKKIYIGTKDDSVEAIFNRFELVFKTDSILSKSCGIKQNS